MYNITFRTNDSVTVYALIDLASEISKTIPNGTRCNIAYTVDTAIMRICKSGIRVPRVDGVSCVNWRDIEKAMAAIVGYNLKTTRANKKIFDTACEIVRATMDYFYNDCPEYKALRDAMEYALNCDIAC